MISDITSTLTFGLSLGMKMLRGGLGRLDGREPVRGYGPDALGLADASTLTPVGGGPSSLEALRFNIPGAVMVGEVMVIAEVVDPDSTTEVSTTTSSSFA
jgi:hypothetical protein